MRFMLRMIDKFLQLIKKFRMENCKPIYTLMALNEKLSQYDGAQKVDPSILGAWLDNYLM